MVFWKDLFRNFLKKCMYIIRTYIHNSLVTLCTYMIPLWHTLSILMKCGAVSTSLFFNFLYIWSYLWCINVLTCIFKRIVASSLYLAQNSHKLSVHMWDWANKCRKVHVTDWLILDEADSLVLDLLIWSNLNPRRRPKNHQENFDELAKAGTTIER